MIKQKTSKDSQKLLEGLRAILNGRKATTQEDLCSLLEKAGYKVNQSKISRLLRKVGAMKVVNSKGETVYSLPREPAPPNMDTPLRNLIVDIVANEALVIIFTSPGCASLVARVLDYAEVSTKILGTLAGDDTIFVAPKSIKDIQELTFKIKKLLRD